MIRHLNFADRHQIIEVMETRKKIWGTVDWDFKKLSFYKRRTTYTENIIAGLFEEDKLDCFATLIPFDYHNIKCYAHGLIVSRKRPNRIKYDNNYDVNFTSLYNYLIPYMSEKGYNEHYSRIGSTMTPMYHNKYSVQNKCLVNIVETVQPGNKISDPILEKYLGPCHPTEINIILKFQNKEDIEKLNGKIQQ